MRISEITITLNSETDKSIVFETASAYQFLPVQIVNKSDTIILISPIGEIRYLKQKFNELATRKAA